jgi:hypothetical protein
MSAPAKRTGMMNAVLCWHRLFGWPALRELSWRLKYAHSWPEKDPDWWWRG